MPENVYEGTLNIGGPVDTTRVYVKFEDASSTMTVRDGRPKPPGNFDKRDLHLSPLGARMLFMRDTREMAAGIRYAMEGTYLGSCIDGPLGSPADGEYDVRIVSRFSLLATFRKDIVTLAIEGATHPGVSGLRQITAAIAPIRFQVAFSVPLARMADFFSLHPEYFTDFERRVKACGYDKR